MYQVVHRTHYCSNLQDLNLEPLSKDNPMYEQTLYDRDSINRTYLPSKTITMPGPRYDPKHTSLSSIAHIERSTSDDGFFHLNPPQFTNQPDLQRAYDCGLGVSSTRAISSVAISDVGEAEQCMITHGKVDDSSDV